MNLIQSLVITGVMIGREGVRRIWPVRKAGPTETRPTWLRRPT